MLKLKTNTPVIVDPKKPTVLKDVFLKIANVKYYIGAKFEVSVQYYYEDEINSGRVDENLNPIMITIQKYLPASTTTFTIQEAQGIEQMSGGLVGATFTDKFDSLIIAGCFFQLDQTPQFGLQANGWSIVA